MKYLFFAGTSNTGKTGSIYRLAKKLISIEGYQVVSGGFPDKNTDFQCILEKDGLTILIHSYTDNSWCINSLIEFIQNSSEIDIIITSIRDIVDPMRHLLIERLQILPSDSTLEIPLGKVRKGNARKPSLEWYNKSIDALSTLMLKTLIEKE